MGERSILELLLRTKKSGTAAKDVSKDLKELKTASGKAGAAAEKLNLGLLAVKGAAITAGVAILGQIGPLMDLGARASRAETALVGLAGGAEEAAEAMEAVMRGAGGSIDRLAAATNASRLFAMGLATNSEEAEKLTRTAVTLGSAMGKGPQQAFEEFTLLLANQSILRLDTFGISAGAVRTRMAELAVEMPNVGREARFLQATMEFAEITMGKLSAAGFEATSSLDLLKAEATNARISIGQFLADGLLPIIDGFRSWKDASASFHEQSVVTFSTFEEYMDAIPTGTIMIGAWTEAEFEAARAAFEAERGMKAEIDRLTGLAAAYPPATAAADGLAEANRGIVASLGELTQAKLASDAMAALNQQWKEGDIDAATYKSTFAAVATNIAGMDGDAAAAQLALFDLNQEFSETGDLDSYLTGVEALGTEIGALESKEIDVIINYMTKGQPAEFQHGGSFTVGGPPGVDNTPVFFMASRGEEVTVTPPARSPGSGGEGVGGRGGPLIGVFNSYGKDDDMVFAEQLKRIARRS